MTKIKSNLALYLVTGLSALLAVVLVYYYLDSRIADERRALEKKYPSQTDDTGQIRVVIATRDLSPGTIIGPDDIRAAEFNRSSVKDTAVISDPSAVIGKKTMQPLFAGEWIVAPRLEGVDPRGNFSAALKNGRRAMRVTVTATSGLLGLIEPSDRIDVIGIFPLDNNGQASRTILQNIEVLAVGRSNPGREQDKEGKAASNAPEGGDSGATVTLEVTTTEAEKLALATQAGKIHLALRNRADQEKDASSLIQLASLAHTPHVDSRPRPQQRFVTVILGDKIETSGVEK